MLPCSTAQADSPGHYHEAFPAAAARGFPCPIMLIGIDGRPLADAMGGSGRYVTELCRALDACLPDARFLVYSNAPVRLPMANGRWALRQDESPWGRRLTPFTWYLLRAGRLAARDGVSAFWGGANFLPLGLPRSILAVVTVLDLVYRVMPESMTFRHRLAFGGLFRASLARADRVSAISRGTSTRLAAFGYRKADFVVLPGVDARFQPASGAAIAMMRKSLGLPGPYLLSVSTLEPRKNLPALIAAFLALSRTGELFGTALVLAGQTGWKDRGIQAAVAEARRLGAEIHLPGHVPEEWLPALYSAAEAFVLPSIYEGFGLPILEARMCGTRVLASDMPETREAGGTETLYVPPTSTGLQAGIREVLGSPRLKAFRDDEDVPRWEVEGRKLAQVLGGREKIRENLD